MNRKKVPRYMWVNQPSTSQPEHALHGTNVLAYHEYGRTWQVFFLDRPVSRQMLGECLSPGWNKGRR